jgi:hypothetical protein
MIGFCSECKRIQSLFEIALQNPVLEKEKEKELIPFPSLSFQPVGPVAARPKATAQLSLRSAFFLSSAQSVSLARGCFVHWAARFGRTATGQRLFPRCCHRQVDPAAPPPSVSSRDRPGLCSRRLIRDVRDRPHLKAQIKPGSQEPCCPSLTLGPLFGFRR